MPTQRKIASAIVLTAFLALGAGVALLLLQHDQSSELREATTAASSNDSAIDALSETELLQSDLDNIDVNDLAPPGPATRRFTLPEDDFNASRLAPLAERYDELVDRARAGDVTAARELGMELWNCRRHMELIAKHAAAIENDSPSSSETQRMAVEERALAYVDSSYTRAEETRCAGISQAQLDGYSDWLELAGNSGDVPAGELYIYSQSSREALAALALRPAELMRFRATGERFLQQSARACSTVGFAHLSLSYPSGPVTTLGRTQSLAYGLLREWSAGNNPSGSGALHALLQGLPESQQREVIAMARRGFNAYCR